MFNKIRRYLRDPYYALGEDLIIKNPNIMSDKYYLSVLWRMLMGYKIDWNNPVTYNEKLQWIKVYDHNPLYTDLVDKLAVKQWVADRIGAEHIIPTITTYNSVEEINLEKLPEQFVLKCNHDSGGFVICTDKDNFDFEKAKAKLSMCFNRNFYWGAREWPYKNVRRQLFAEKYIEEKGQNDTSFAGLKDYKFFCFDGEPKIMYVSNDKAELPTTDFFDMDGHSLPIVIKDPPSPVPQSLPEHFEEMKEMASVLSKGLPEVRVDFYENNDMVLFGEMTFFHDAGLSEVHPLEWNQMMGSWIKLPPRRR